MTTTQLIEELTEIVRRLAELRHDGWVPDLETALKGAERHVREIILDLILEVDLSPRMESAVELR